MNGNDGTGNNVNRDDWETPQELWEKLNEQYIFTVDCCASKQNTKCPLWFDIFESKLWEDNKIHWINPPFSKADQMIKHFFKVVKKGVGIYRCDNIETSLWNFILIKADWVHIIKGRTNYVGHEGKGARFGSALFGIGLPPPKGINGVTVKKI